MFTVSETKNDFVYLNLFKVCKLVFVIIPLERNSVRLLSHSLVKSKVQLLQLCHTAQRRREAGRG